MSPLIIYEGKILTVDGALASSIDCCCSSVTSLFPWEIQLNINFNTFTCQDISFGNWGRRCYIGGGPSDSAGPLPTGYWPEYSFINDCNGDLCYPDPFILAGLDTRILAFAAGATQEIITNRFPMFTVQINNNYINTNYPQEEGWTIFYQEEYIQKEYRTYFCEFYNIYELCRGFRANIKFYAFKECDNEPTLEDITDNVVTGSLAEPSQFDITKISDTEYVALNERETSEECVDIPPAFLGFTSMVTLSCHKECPSIEELMQ